MRDPITVARSIKAVDGLPVLLRRFHDAWSAAEKIMSNMAVEVTDERCLEGAVC